MALGRVLGVRVRVHWLFLALLAFASAFGALRQAAVLLGGLLSHELAHLLVARATGLAINEVELYPFGGVARVSGDLDQDPYATALTAAAGPFNNFLLLALGLGFRGAAWLDPALLDFFNQVNLTLALFNLIPVVPLDGGRIYRSYLSRRYGFVRATRRLAQLGRVAGLLLLVCGVLAAAMGRIYLGLFILPAFLYLSAVREEGTAMFAPWRGLLRVGSELKRQGVLPAGQLVMMEDAPLQDALSLLGADRYHLVTVLDRQMRPVGVLSEAELLEGLSRHGPAVTAGELLHRRP